VVSCGVVSCGVVSCGVVSCGVASCGVASCGVASCGVAAVVKTHRSFVNVARFCSRILVFDTPNTARYQERNIAGKWVKKLRMLAAVLES